ncbi:MAG TPA: YkgJ family cysteine cluster protein [Gemmataceae bacterium]|nr:YkgJ family cysteine cluster protein [Gemmataceae bacterium]
MDTFNCDSCGACCKTFPIFASAADAQREPRIRADGQRLPTEQTTPQWEYRPYPLPFLETCCFLRTDNGYDIYATRPEVCRHFAAGSAQCQEARARQGLPLLTAISEIERG